MKMNKQQTKALEKLNDAITNLPEFGAVMKLVPSNVAITNCELTECETTREWGKGKNKVTYHGLVLHDGDKKEHEYLIQRCGLEYFTTKKTLEQIANDILTAVANAPKKKDPLMHALSVADYLKNELEWEMTDEVYPHMRDNAEGGFIVEKFREQE